MPTGVIVPYIFTQFCDANGDPLSGGKVYAYAAGTSTPLDTYTDVALAVPNTNPIILDAGGRCTMFVTPATAYKFVLYTSADVLVRTLDDVTVATPDASVTKIVAGTGVSIAYTGATSGTGDVTITATTGVPTGAILPYGAAAAPTGYLLCDGTAVSRTTYAALFAALASGATWGTGDGSTTFNVPDLRGKFPLGLATAGTGSTLGGTGGTIDHVHTGPSHTHDAGTLAGPSHTHTGPSHTHTGTTDNHTASVDVDTGGGPVTVAVSGTHNHTFTTAAGGTGNTGASGTGSVTGATAAAGTGNTGVANPPFAAVQYIIKT